MSETSVMLAAVAAASNSIMQHFRSGHGVDYKDDASPVTIADREAELAIRKHLVDAFPNDGIIGEEFPAINLESNRQWVIDPIDGTQSFIAGKPFFTTLLALIEDQTIKTGLIYQPILNELWFAANGKTTFNNQPVATSNIDCLSKAVLATTAPHYLPEPQWLKFKSLSSYVRFTHYGGDAYNYAILASGHIDCVVECGLKLHDYAALVPVIEGAGGIVTDWHGNPLQGEGTSSIVASSNKKLHVQILEKLHD